MKLIRLTTIDENLNFNSYFNEDIHIKQNSKICLNNLCFEKFEEKLVIDNTNNKVLISFLDGGDQTEIILENESYGISNFNLFKEDFQNKLNESLSTSNPYACGSSFKIEVDGNNRLFIEQDFDTQQDTIDVFSTVNINHTDEQNIFKSSNDLSWDAGIGSNTLECYDGKHGCGIFRMQLNQLDTSGEGVYIGLSTDDLNGMNGDFDPSKCLYCIQAVNASSGDDHILTSTITTPGTGYASSNRAQFTGGTGVGATYHVLTTNATSGIVTYEITNTGTGYTIGDVLTFSHNGDSMATMTVNSVSNVVGNLYKFKNPENGDNFVTSTTAIENSTVGNDDNDILSIEASEGKIEFIIYNSSNPNGILLGGSFPAIDEQELALVPVIGIHQVANTSIKNISITPYNYDDNGLNLNNNLLVSTLTPNNQDISKQLKRIEFENIEIAQKLGFLTKILTVENVEFDFLAINTIEFFDLTTSFIVLLDNIQLNSYDDYDPNHTNRGGRRNILKVIAHAEINKQLIYEPATQYFIDINNPEPLILRNFKLRVLKNDYTPVKSINLSTLTLLIKEKDE